MISFIQSHLLNLSTANSTIFDYVILLTLLNIPAMVTFMVVAACENKIIEKKIKQVVDFIFNYWYYTKCSKVNKKTEQIKQRLLQVFIFRLLPNNQ